MWFDEAELRGSQLPVAPERDLWPLGDLLDRPPVVERGAGPAKDPTDLTGDPHGFVCRRQCVAVPSRVKNDALAHGAFKNRPTHAGEELGAGCDTAQASERISDVEMIHALGGAGPAYVPKSCWGAKSSGGFAAEDDFGTSVRRVIHLIMTPSCSLRPGSGRPLVARCG